MTGPRLREHPGLPSGEEQPPGLAGRLVARLPEWVVPVSLIVLFVVVQSLFLRPIIQSDQSSYMKAAANLFDMNPTHRSLRLGLVIPTWVAQQAFGYSEVAYRAFPVLASIGFVVGLWGLARVLFGRGTALVAGLLAVFNPYVLFRSSELLPDLGAAAAFTGAMVLVLLVGRRFAATGAVVRFDRGLLVTAGLLLGLSYLIREFTPLFFPLILLAFLLDRLPWRLLVWVVVPTLGALAFEYLWGAVVLGDPFVRFKAIVFERQLTPELAEELRAAGELDITLLESLRILPRLLLERTLGYVVLAGVAVSAAVAAVWRDRRLVFLLAWAGAIFVLFVVIPMLDTTGGPGLIRTVKLRYWYPILPPLIVAGVAATGAVVGWLARRVRWSAGRVSVLATVLVLGVLAAGTRDVVAADIWQGGEENEYLEFREWLAADGQAHSVLWTNAHQERLVRIYRHSPFGRTVWDGAVRWLDSERGYVGPEHLDDGVLVLTRRAVEVRLPGSRGALPDHLREPPLGWRLLFQSRNGDLRVYELDGPPPTPIDEIEPASGWTVLPRSGDSFDEERVVDLTAGLQLESDDRVLLTDGRAPGMAKPDGPALDRDVRVVRIDTDLEFDGGRIRPVCLFYGPERTRARVPAHVFFDSESLTGNGRFACRVPELDGPLGVRFAMVLHGPLAVTAEQTSTILAN